MKALFTIQPKDRNDVPGTEELEKRVYEIKRIVMDALGEGDYTLETGFDQSSTLYPRRFLFDYESEGPGGPGPKDVIDAFFDAVYGTGICLAKYDIHVSIV